VFLCFDRYKIFPCVSGTADELPCEPGYYSATTGLEEAVQCGSCPGGFYCPGMLREIESFFKNISLRLNSLTNISLGGGTDFSMECVTGYFCNGTAHEGMPENKAYGDVCPTG